MLDVATVDPDESATTDTTPRKLFLNVCFRSSVDASHTLHPWSTLPVTMWFFAVHTQLQIPSSCASAMCRSTPIIASPPRAARDASSSAGRLYRSHERYGARTTPRCRFARSYSPERQR